MYIILFLCCLILFHISVIFTLYYCMLKIICTVKFKTYYKMFTVIIYMQFMCVMYCKNDLQVVPNLVLKKIKQY